MGNKTSKNQEPDPESAVAPASPDTDTKDEPPPLDNTSEQATSPKQLWLIRHGERMDEAGTKEAMKWRKTVSRDRWFDPPLTKQGFEQAAGRGQSLVAQLAPFKSDAQMYPRFIYCSPLERTLGT